MENKGVYQVTKLRQIPVIIPEQTLLALEKEAEAISAGGVDYSIDKVVSGILIDWAIAQQAAQLQKTAKELPGH